MSNAFMEGLLALLPFILAGFAAQMVDGALGMAFGVISNTILLSLGVPPAAASAGTHTVETFTSGASGLSHLFHGNIDWKLFGRLAVPGIIGGALGAYVLTQFEANDAKPFVLGYLGLIGFYLIWRGFHYPPEPKKPKVIEPLGLIGGFMDAAGGGGWGPIVTGNLLAQGAEPRKTIGTVSAAEFLLALTVSITFLLTLGWAAFTTATLGLLIGGVLAAPLAAWAAKKAAPKFLLVLVGVLLTITSLYGVYQAIT